LGRTYVVAASPAAMGGLYEGVVDTLLEQCRVQLNSECGAGDCNTACHPPGKLGQCQSSCSKLRLRLWPPTSGPRWCGSHPRGWRGRQSLGVFGPSFNVHPINSGARTSPQTLAWFAYPQGGRPTGFEIGVCICADGVASGDFKSGFGAEANVALVHTRGGRGGGLRSLEGSTLFVDFLVSSIRRYPASCCTCKLALWVK